MKLSGTGPKLSTPKVKAPRNNPSGRVRPPLGFANVTAPRIKPTRTRDYRKTPSIQDPAQEGGTMSGFGDTGLTGES